MWTTNNVLIILTLFQSKDPDFKMVLTDLPFDRCALLHNRYDMIRRPDSAPTNGKPPPSEEESAEESKEYAAFLK